ncbi:MAG TPA: hypothetical protein VMS17_24255 [Gemmataceae bacterium]|nr:hypothetical protein [Gemmataceae bacterium]
MMRRASRSLYVPLALGLAGLFFAAGRAVADPAEELPAEGHNKLGEDYKASSDTWFALVAGQTAADPRNKTHQDAIDVAARWVTYRLTWGLEKEGKFSEVLQELGRNLDTIRLNRDKTPKVAELFAKQLIIHAKEVLQTRKPIARINAAYILARLADRPTVDEKMDDVLRRLAGTNQADLADALADTIRDPNQIDAAKFWAFRGLQRLLSLPRSDPPLLPPEKEQAALGEVVKWLEAHNKATSPGTPEEELDGFRYVRREAIAALAAGRYPTLSALPDKPHPTLLLLKIAARDGIEPELRLDERLEAAIGVAHAQPSLDKDYQPEYAVHLLGQFVVDFMTRYDAEKQAHANDASLPWSQPWKVEASRLIEALELMKAQSKSAYVAMVADASLDVLKPVERAGPTSNIADLDSNLRAHQPPSKSLYQSAPDSTVTFGGKPPAPPEEKKDK